MCAGSLHQHLFNEPHVLCNVLLLRPLVSGCAARSMSRGGRLLEQSVQVQTSGHWTLPGCRGQSDCFSSFVIKHLIQFHQINKLCSDIQYVDNIYLWQGDYVSAGVGLSNLLDDFHTVEGVKHEPRNDLLDFWAGRFDQEDKQYPKLCLDSGFLVPGGEPLLYICRWIQSMKRSVWSPDPQ